MTISAYTELQPVNTAVNEMPQAQEIEEDEPGEFAKLLAGLLQKTETDNEAVDVPLVDFSGDEVELDALTGEKLNLFAAAPETEDVSEKELSETGIAEEQMGVLLSAEHLLVRSNEPAVTDVDTDVEFSRRLSNVEMKTHKVDIEPQANSSSVITDTGEAASLEQIAAAELAAANAEESLIAETGKKDRALNKSENIEAPPVASRSEEPASLRTAPEKESRSRLDEARSRSRRDKVTFEVRDLRTGTETLKSTEMRLNVGAETRAQGDAPVREITLELRLPEGHSSPQTSWEIKAGNALENMLARELHQNFNGDIVRHASMALRDGGEGTIRLALKPESLGNVKIHLEMTENKITGHIVVESEEALNAFRREIASLEQAFRDSGFENANLNLSLTADGRNTEGQEQEMNSWIPRMVASRYEDSFEQDSSSLVDVFLGRRPGSVNMLA